MATPRQTSSSDLALQKAISSVKSNHQIDSESQAFLPNQLENRLQPNCDGLDKFAMQFFDEKAMRAYLQLLHGLIERLTEKSKNSYNTSSCEDFSVTLDKHLRICERNRRVGKAETRSRSVEKCSKSQAKNAPRMQNIDVELKKKSLRKGSSSRKIERKKCTFCDLAHAKGKENCKAYNKICHKCKQYNHFAVVCRTRKPKMKVEKAEKQTVANVGSTHRPQSTPEIPVRKENKEYCLKWLNGKLQEEYESFAALGDGVGLLKLMNISLGMSSHNCSQPWAQIEDLLLISDKEVEINVEDLKGSKDDAMMKLILWLKTVERGKHLEASESWGDSEKISCCNLK